MNARERAEQAHFDRMVREEVEKRLSDTWLKGSELSKRIHYFSKNWLKEHGEALPRVFRGNAWYYNFGSCERMFLEGLI